MSFLKNLFSLFFLLYFIKSQDLNVLEKNLNNFSRFNDNNIDRTKYSRIEIVFNHSKEDVFYFYLPKGKYNWDSFLNKCKEFAENQEYSTNYEYIKTNNIFENRVFKYDLYGVKYLGDIEKNRPKDLEGKLKDYKLEGDFDIDKDYSFGFQNGCYSCFPPVFHIHVV